MEKDIKIIKLIMNETYSDMVNQDGKRIYKLSDRQRQALLNLINRIKELEAIEEEHRKENGKLQEKIKELVEDNRHQWEERCKMAIELDNNVVPKSKIKEKIEELKENNNGDDYSLINVINILKELLEEQVE